MVLYSFWLQLKCWTALFIGQLCAGDLHVAQSRDEEYKNCVYLNYILSVFLAICNVCRYVFETMMLDPETRSCGAALLSTILTYKLSSRQHEVVSEAVCWTTLLIVLSVRKYLQSRQSSTTATTAPLSIAPRQADYSRSLWQTAVCFTVVVSYRAELGWIQVLPILTPCLLIAEKHRPLETTATGVHKLSVLKHLDRVIYGSLLVAGIAFYAMPRGSPVAILLSCVPAAALLAICLFFTFDSPPVLPPAEEIAIPFCLRAVPCLLAVLAAQVTLFGFPKLDVSSFVFLSLAKALSWCFLAQTAQYTSWSLPTSILTFSAVSTIDPSKQFHEPRCLAQVVASFLILRQIIHLLPQKAVRRAVLWIFFLVSLGPYLANVLAIRLAQDNQVQNFDSTQPHPVEVIVPGANRNFEKLLRNQSKSYEEARDEYHRRYSVQPPEGFEAWYNFAVSNQSPFIDEFDMIVNATLPFWRLSGKDVLGVMSDIETGPYTDIWACTFHGETAKTTCSNPHRKFDKYIEQMFNQMLGELHGVLPDIKFLVNPLDEPKVLIPPAALGDNQKNTVNSFELSKQPTWETITKYCVPQKTNMVSSTADQIEAYGIPFVVDQLEATDLCQHSNYGSLHGFLQSPTTFHLLEGLVPILSTGSLSTMGDILYPSPAYREPAFSYNEAHDVDWERKQNSIYWAGSTTGGYAKDDKWQDFHRHRFVKLAQNLGPRQHSYLRNKAGTIHRVISSFFNTRLFNVYFTRFVQCDMRYCRDQRAYFETKSYADKDQALQSRLAFDLDGNGISGRYYKLMASKSLPLKQTIFREWHDERLMPWVHYIPISMGMEELPELVSYLTSTEAGQVTAKTIAEQGRTWMSKAFRDVDMAIYLYRLMLELARLQDPQRQAT